MRVFIEFAWFPLSAWHVHVVVVQKIMVPLFCIFYHVVSSALTVLTVLVKVFCLLMSQIVKFRIVVIIRTVVSARMFSRMSSQLDIGVVPS